MDEIVTSLTRHKNVIRRFLSGRDEFHDWWKYFKIIPPARECGHLIGRRVFPL